MGALPPGNDPWGNRAVTGRWVLNSDLTRQGTIGHQPLGGRGLRHPSHRRPIARPGQAHRRGANRLAQDGPDPAGEVGVRPVHPPLGRSADVNPSRYYLGVRLGVAMYLATFPDQAPRFRHLESRIISDARERAMRQLLGTQVGGRSAFWGFRSLIAEETLAQCWAGNPAACR
jgi:hypothetical protein